jgi:hypothetical protein
MLLPALAAHVAATEVERHRTILKMSELQVHTDRSDSDIILSKSWKRAHTPEERYEHARPAIIVLGPHQDTVLDVCIAKKKCDKHWPSAATSTEAAVDAVSPDDAEGSNDEEAAREPAEWQKRQQEQRRWAEELRPHALRLFAERTMKLAWSWPLLRQLLSELDISEPEAEIESSELADLVGAPHKLPTKRYPQVLAVAFAIQRSWNRENFLNYAKQLGVSMGSTNFTINVSPVDPTAMNRSHGAVGRSRPTRRSRAASRVNGRALISRSGRAIFLDVGCLPSLFRALSRATSHRASFHRSTLADLSSSTCPSAEKCWWRC